MTTGDIPETDADASVLAAAGAAKRYAAFISYSHADEVAAKLLHRRLETYRLPPHVRSSKGETRVGTIFRDRADLAAASDLTDSIKSALAESGALVVLCSPEARQSQWVDAEIRLFRELNPTAPVLAVILRGEPAEALPHALVEGGREPLAADFRKDGDGIKLGFLKVVAALKALPLDSLIQRDAQRRLRRVIGITVVAVTALLAMMGMTAYAISAQREAERQRAEAEGLVEFMLTDLRTRLHGVGRIDVMSAVNDRALDYYDNQGDLAGLSDDSLERRARVLQAMAQDELRRDDKAAAQRLARAAYDSTAALLARSPDNPDRIFAHAQSEYAYGSLAWANDNEPLYRRSMSRYAVLAERLAQVDPDRIRAQREIGYAQGNLCYIAQTLDRPVSPSAASHCAEALAAQRRVLAMQPDDRQTMMDVANRLTWYGAYRDKIGETASAITLWTEAAQIARQIIAADPINKDSQDMLVAVLLSRSKGFANIGNVAAARNDLDEASEIVGRLRETDPSNNRWARLSQELADVERGFTGMVRD